MYRIKNGEWKYLGNRISNGKVSSIPVKVKNADLESFKILNHLYAKDKNNVYFQNKKIISADLKTFSLIDDLNAKDKNHAYFLGESLYGIEPENFFSIGNGYTTDGKQVYYGGKHVYEADHNSFQSFAIGRAFDVNHIFLHHEPEVSICDLSMKEVEEYIEHSFKCEKNKTLFRINHMDTEKRHQLLGT